MASITPQQFVQKWRSVDLKERSASQEHFIDLCHLVGHPTPAEADPTGEWFAFEYGIQKTGGGDGFADVWKKGYFGWEYKGKHADLVKAYDQLLKYRESLQNPPLLVVCDLGVIEIHSNFTNTVKQKTALTYDDLLTSAGMTSLRAVFHDPGHFRSTQTVDQVTQTAAIEFAKLSEQLRAQGTDPHDAAHFLIRILFCLFAEDVGLLPDRLFTVLIDELRHSPSEFTEAVGELFEKMAKGGRYGAKRIKYFNGRLFDDARVLPIDRPMLDTLAHVARLDWASIEPSIFGTLFERSLDPSKRGQLGAHFTGKDDILLVVEPVLMEPLRRQWEEVKREVDELVAKWREAGAAKKSSAAGYFNRALERLQLFSRALADVVVLDPACGSGNFLYVALRLLLDLEKEVIAYAGTFGGTSWFPQVSPAQLRGIEKDEYAHELAQATIWIGYIQWLSENGFGVPPEPILQAMDNIERKDAVLAYDENGRPIEPAWPAATVIVGNPPFLGGNKVRKELSDEYVDMLFELYKSTVPAFSDLVCYWFYRGYAQVASGSARRVGFISTNSIRDGVNRKVLDMITAHGRIFLAFADRPWILNGADVRVSLIGFDADSGGSAVLNGVPVSRINSDLTTGVDVTTARPLPENSSLYCYGSQQKGSFEIAPDTALGMLDAPNPNGLSNRLVVRPSINAQRLVKRTEPSWVIDFGDDMALSEAAEYEAPFEWVKANVLPERQHRRELRQRTAWWLHARPSPKYRRFIRGHDRVIVTPTVSKHRLFAWLPSDQLANHTLIVFLREDDYTFGVLHSRLHETWSLATGGRIGVGNDPCYRPDATIATFPFPWAPGSEPTDDPRVEAIATAARELVEKRDRWLNPEGATEAELKKRTLTNLYNKRPTWLELAHRKLDEAVFAAYGWPADLSDDEILARLLKLNHERAAAQTH